jgi:hypothetical protein
MVRVLEVGEQGRKAQWATGWAETADLWPFLSGHPPRILRAEEGEKDAT